VLNCRTRKVASTKDLAGWRVSLPHSGGDNYGNSSPWKVIWKLKWIVGRGAEMWGRNSMRCIEVATILAFSFFINVFSFAFSSRYKKRNKILHNCLLITIIREGYNNMWNENCLCFLVAQEVFLKWIFLIENTSFVFGSHFHIIDGYISVTSQNICINGAMVYFRIKARGFFWKVAKEIVSEGWIKSSKATRGIIFLLKHVTEIGKRHLRSMIVRRMGGGIGISVLVSGDDIFCTRRGELKSKSNCH